MGYGGYSLVLSCGNISSIYGVSKSIKLEIFLWNIVPLVILPAWFKQDPLSPPREEMWPHVLRLCVWSPHWSIKEEFWYLVHCMVCHVSVSVPVLFTHILLHRRYLRFLFQEGDCIESRVLTIDLSAYPDNALDTPKKSPVKASKHR